MRYFWGSWPVTAFALTPASGAQATLSLPAVQVLGATAAGPGQRPIPLSPAGKFGKVLVKMTIPAGRWWISAKLTAKNEPSSAIGETYADCKLAKLFYTAAGPRTARADVPRQVLKGSVVLDENLLEITEVVPPAGGPGQSAGPNVVSAVMKLRSKSIIGVLCTDAGHHTEASDVVLSAVGS